VNNGSGGGEYEAEQTITIEADLPDEGMIFDEWTENTGSVANVSNPTTTVTMPEGNVTVSAAYKEKPEEKFVLTVNNGSGSGEYEVGYQVGIAADPAPEGRIFKNWTGDVDTIANVSNPNTRLRMPENDASITAVFEDEPQEEFTLSVGSGSGSGGYKAGTMVTVSADVPEDDQQVFERWNGDTQYVANPDASSSTVIMPESNVSITARFRENDQEQYILTVQSGTGSGEYEPGYTASIAASPASEGLVFDQWVGNVSRVGNTYNPNTVVSMPEMDVTVRATYKEDPGLEDPRQLTVNHGTGSGEYRPGRVASIAADVREGFIFDRWVGQTSHVTNVNIPNTTVVMPDAKMVVTATFKPDTEDLFRLRQRVFVPNEPQSRQTTAARAFLKENADPVEVLTPAGRIMRISAPAAPDGYAFDKWIGQTANVDNIHLAQTYVYMPDNDVDVTASYAALPEEAVLEVEGGEGAGTYAPGTVVDIQADEPEEGMMFDKWEGQTAQVANVNLATTTLTMPGTSVRIQAVFREIPEDMHDLTVRGGQGSGEYAAATFQTIVSAPPADENQIFARWIGQVANLEDVNAEETTVYMPPNDVEVVATYARFFTVGATSGAGGSISPGSRDVIENERTTFTVTPDDGYRVAQVNGCGGGLSRSSYTTGLITEACTVTASFEQLPESHGLYFPHVDGSGDWVTEIALINHGASPAAGTLRSVRATGQKAASCEMTLNPGQRVEYETGHDCLPAITGYAVFETTADNLVGYTKFYQPGQARSSVQVIRPTVGDTAYVPHIHSDQEWWTGLGVVNTTDAPVNMTLDFADGEQAGIALDSGAQISFEVSDEHPEAQAGVQTATIANAAGMVGLELFGWNDGRHSNQEGFPLSDAAARTLVFPHVHHDQEWWTGISVFNTAQTPTELTMTFYSAAGQVLGNAEATVQGRRSMVGTPDSLEFPAGTAWFTAQADQNLTGFVLFGKVFNGDAGGQLGGISLPNLPRTTGVLPKLEADGWTGIALVNPGLTQAEMTLEALDNAGTVISTASLTINARSKLVDMAGSFFDQDISAATYLRYTANQNIAAFQLNGSGDGRMLDGLPALR